MPQIFVLLADAQPLVREGIRQRFDQESDIYIAAEADGATEAVALCQQHQPAVALIDVELPGNGFEACTAVFTRCAGTAVVLLSNNDWDAKLARGWASGASAFVVKTSPFEDLVRIIREVAAGARLFTPEQSERIRIWQQEVEAKLETLRARQREVLVLLVAGYPNPEIAKELVISLKTVESHVGQVFAKLEAGERDETRDGTKDNYVRL